MSSPDWSRRRALAGLSLALLAAGCNFRPLYAPGLGGGSLATVLAAVDIAPINTREGQKLRNELIFMFRGGGDPVLPPLYRLNITVTDVETPLTISAAGGLPTADVITATAVYTLASAKTGEPVLVDTVTARASYDRSVQRFAALRAKRDAEDRAMQTLAELIRTQIAAKLASGQVSPTAAPAAVAGAAIAPPPTPGAPPAPPLH